VHFWEMTPRFWFLLFLLLPIIEGAFSNYLRNLLRAGTTTTTQSPNRKGRPADQGGEETSGTTIDSTDAPETTEGGGETTRGGTIGPPSTGEPAGSTAPPQPSSPVPPSTGPASSGAPGSTTTAISTTTRCSVGVWSEWREEMKCNANCGACGTVVRRRTCTTAAAGCPCEGDFRSSRPCRISACPYPQPSCCPPFNLIFVNGTFACGPQNEVVMAEYLAELSSRASSSTRGPSTPLIATRPHRTSPTAVNGTTTTAVPGSTPPSPTLVPTGGPVPEPTRTPGPNSTGDPVTTEEPEGSTGAPVEGTTEGEEEETTPAGEEDEIDPRPWYHRLKPMSKLIEATPMWMQYHA
ncbi:hypothetical protein PMAYCL1PPCAC_24403, partial [Pristionchus mayeri]